MAPLQARSIKLFYSPKWQARAVDDLSRMIRACSDLRIMCCMWLYFKRWLVKLPLKIEPDDRLNSADDMWSAFARAL